MCSCKWPPAPSSSSRNNTTCMLGYVYQANHNKSSNRPSLHLLTEDRCPCVGWLWRVCSVCPFDTLLTRIRFQELPPMLSIIYFTQRYVLMLVSFHMVRSLFCYYYCILTIACSILLSIATALVPDALQHRWEKRRRHKLQLSCSNFEIIEWIKYRLDRSRCLFLELLSNQHLIAVSFWKQTIINRKDYHWTEKNYNPRVSVEFLTSTHPEQHTHSKSLHHSHSHYYFFNNKGKKTIRQLLYTVAGHYYSCSRQYLH